MTNMEQELLQGRFIVPNSLTELNDFSTTAVTSGDDRAYSITWSANTASNQSVSTTEDIAIIIPTGVDLVDAVSIPSGNITYNIDLSSFGANAILNWPTLPTGVTSGNASGVHSITGVFDATTWSDAVQASLTLKDRTSNYSFTSNVRYPNIANVSNFDTKNWTTNVSITSSHAELSTPTNFYWDEDTATLITGAPQITDAYVGPGNYTIVITPNVANAVLNMVTTGSANSTLNPTTKALTITGPKASVNVALGNITMTPYPDYQTSFNLNYSLTNPVSNVNTQVNQTAMIGNIIADWTMTNNYNFAEDQATQLVYHVYDTDTTASSYTLLVDQTAGTDGAVVINGVSAGVGNVGNLTTANVTAFNSANVTFVPYSDDTGNVTLTLSAYKNNISGNVTIATGQTATLTCNSTHSEYTLGGSFTENTKFAFGNIITDTDPNVSTYTISIRQSATDTAYGKWYVGNTLVGNANTTYTITDTKANINGLGLQWLPGWEESTATFEYSQSKNTTYFGNVVQASNVSIAKSVSSTVPGMTNLTARTFTGNTTSTIYSTSTPQISDGPDYGQTYTLEFVADSGGSPYGRFGGTDTQALNNIGTSTIYTLTGTASAINANIASTVFAPISTAGASGTWAFNLYRDGVLSSKSLGNTLTNSGAATNFVYSFTTANTWQPSAKDLYYGNQIDVLAVGGGGGGANYGSLSGPSGSPMRSGGGGAGGNVKTSNALSLANVVYTITVGQGGNAGVAVNAVGNTGGTTTLSNVSGTIISAEGGGGACVAQWGYGGFVGAYSGGDRGGGNIGVGPYYGGGGAGAGASGTAATPTSPYIVGEGGIGKSSSITGTATYYGGGGGGGAYWTGNVGNGGNGGGGGTNRATSAGENGRGGGGSGSGTAQGYDAGNGGSGILIIKVRN